MWQVLSRGIEASLIPRLTRVGECELVMVSALCDSLLGRSGLDERLLRHVSGPRGTLSSSMTYMLMWFGSEEAGYADMIWGSWCSDAYPRRHGLEVHFGGGGRRFFALSDGGRNHGSLDVLLPLCERLLEE